MSLASLAEIGAVVLLHRYSVRAGAFRKIIEVLPVWTVRLNQAFNEEFSARKARHCATAVILFQRDETGVTPVSSSFGFALSLQRPSQYNPMNLRITAMTTMTPIM